MSEAELDSLGSYFREIRDYPLLTAEQEVELGEKIREGGPEAETAKDQLVKSNQRLVVSVAKKFQGRGLPLEDLIGEGQIGLLRAVDKFDYRQGNRFSTYATWWIKQAISRAVNNTGRIIRLPVHIGEGISKMNRVSEQLRDRLAREPTLAEIAGEMDTTVRKVRKIMQVSQSTISLDKPVGEEKTASLANLLEDESAPSPLDAATGELLKEELGDILSSLSDREREVIELRFGLRDGVKSTLKEVGDVYGVGRERIRQIETKALRKLKHPIRGRRLRDFLTGD